MKISWGTGIVIAIGLFMTFILYFVITMVTDDKYSYELVVEDYYKQEIGFQNELDAEINAAYSPLKIKINHTPEGVLFEFPDAIAREMEEGTVSFYRVSKKILDFEKPLVLENNTMLVPAQELVPGRWDITVRWHIDGKHYLTKEKINF